MIQGSGTKIKLSYSSLVRIGTTGSAHPGSNNHDNSPPHSNYEGPCRIWGVSENRGP